MKFTADSLDMIAGVHAEIVQAEDETVRGFYDRSQALLVAGIEYVYPDLNVEELREVWQDNGFDKLSKSAQYLRDQRDWLERNER